MFDFPYGISNIYTAADLIAAACIAILGIVVYVGRKAESARMFAIMLAAIFFWAVSIAGITSALNNDALLIAVRTSYFFGGLIMAVFAIYTLSIGSDKPQKIYVNILWLSQAILSWFYIYSDLIVSTASLGNSATSATWQFGEYGILALVNFAVMVSVGIARISHVFKHNLLPVPDEVNKQRIKIFRIAIWGMLPSAALTILLPRLGIFSFYWFGPILISFWVFFILYSLVRYKFLSVRLFIVELVILFFAGILFASVVVSHFRESSFILPQVFHISSFNLFSIVCLATALVVTVVADIIFRRTITRDGRSVAYMLLGLGGILYLGTYYYNLPGDYVETIITATRILYWGIVSFCGGFFYFSYAYQGDSVFGSAKPKIRTAVWSILGLLFVFYVFTPNVISSVDIGLTPATRYIVFGGLAKIFFTIPVGLFTAGGCYLLSSRAKNTADVRSKRHVQYVALTSTVLLLPVGLIFAGIPFYPTFIVAPYLPIAATIWGLVVSYTTLRHEIPIIRTIVPGITVVGILSVALANLFVTVGPDLSSFSIRSTTDLNPYVLLNWLVSFILGVFSLYMFLLPTNPFTKRYAYILFVTMLWSIGIAFLYIAPTETSYVLWVRLNHITGPLIAALFCYFTLDFTFKTSGKIYETLYWLFYFLYSTITLFTPVIVNRAIFFSTTDVLNRQYENTSYTWITYTLIVAYFTVAVITLYRQRKKAGQLDPKIIKRTIIFTVLGFLPGIVFISLFALVGPNNLSWLAPTATLGMLMFGTYPILSEFGHISRKMFYAEIGVFVFICLLFGVFILPQEWSINTLSRMAVFLAFATIGGFLIGNVTKNEEQREKLASLSEELSRLNKQLTARIEERTGDLRSAHEHTNAIIEKLTTGLVEYDPNFVVLRINEAAEKILGVKRAEIVGKQILPEMHSDPKFSIVTTISYPALAASYERMSPQSENENQSISSHIISISTPSTLELQVTTAPVIDTNGQTTGFIKLIRDITRERQIARSKSEFVTIAAHQLRTPLSVVKWSLDLISSGDMGPLSDIQKTTINKATYTNERMVSLVNDLLVVSRIEDGKLPYEFSDGDITEMIQKITDQYRDFALSKHIALSFKLPATPFPAMTFDAQKLSMAIGIIVDNAVRYTRDGGAVNIQLSQNNSYAEISVRDNGIGISKQNQTRLFTKFFRADNAVRNTPDGFGLGLFIAKNIIVRHGGNVAIMSDEGIGTTVTINLPMDKTLIPTETIPAEEIGLESLQ